MRQLDYKKLIQNLQQWLKDYLTASGLKGYILGLSGGIDSAVTAGLCVGAVGKENLLALGLPCESISKDLDHAKLVVETLKIPFHVIDLTSTYKELLKSLPSGIKENKMAMSNIKPRLRMTTLYYVGQSLGYLVAGTGNRTEIAIGYFTKYGDGGVDLEPLGDLYKCEVREIARLLNIPDIIITKPPSAGLWDGQTDEGEIGMSYNNLDEIIYRMDKDLDFEGLDKNNMAKVKRMMEIAEHKIKMPPTFKIKN